MRNLSAKFSKVLTVCFLLGVFGCVEDPFTNDTLSNADPKLSRMEKVSADSDLGNTSLRSDLTDNPGPSRLPTPTIIHQTFIPSYSLWAHTKCLTWRISWPTYNWSVDESAKPTVFNRNNGALNSFNYLNSTDPLNTINSTFSLYTNNKVEGTIHMASDGLNHVPWGGAGMEWVKFAKVNFPINTIKHWVEDRPSNFESHMPAVTSDHLFYNEGDIILFNILGENRYGGIRIVSMNPRVIEVYLAVPNI